MGVRWYVAYPLSSYRRVEELMEERGVPVDHATIRHLDMKYSHPIRGSVSSPQASGVDKAGGCGEETCIRSQRPSRYLYRAVGRDGSDDRFPADGAAR